jgi:LDH2 family malate/lactate/ureidoglycolate dehydrogenase
MFLLYRAYTNSFSFFWISLFWVLDVEAWRNRDEFEQEVRKAIASLKDTPRLDPNQPIYYPGELEAISREQRSC